MNFKPVVAAIALLYGAASVAWADEDVSALLQALRGADAGEALVLERKIQRQWSRSGSDAMDLLLERGRDATGQGDYDAAIGHLTALVDHAPDFAEGYHARATAYYLAGHFGPAIADLEKTLALNPNHFRALLGLGVVFLDIGDHVQARAAFAAVRAIHPSSQDLSKVEERLRLEERAFDL